MMFVTSHSIFCKQFWTFPANLTGPLGHPIVARVVVLGIVGLNDLFGFLGCCLMLCPFFGEWLKREKLIVRLSGHTKRLGPVCGLPVLQRRDQRLEVGKRRYLHLPASGIFIERVRHPVVQLCARAVQRDCSTHARASLLDFLEETAAVTVVQDQQTCVWVY